MGLRVVLSLYALRFLFRSGKIEIQALHPDGAGGLGPVADLSVQLTGAVFFTGILVAGGVFSNVKMFGMEMLGAMNLIMLISFVVCSFVVVFFPLILAHRGMRDHRTRVLGDINLRFQENFCELRESISSKGFASDKLKELEAKIETYNRFYDMAKKQPIWPFNLKVIFTFIGSILTPVAVVILQIAIEKYVFGK